MLDRRRGAAVDAKGCPGHEVAQRTGAEADRGSPGERLVITAGLKLIVVPIDSTWTRRSLASGSRARLPTPAEPERVAPASASRSGPVPRVGAPERRW
jgi:hypothetical protein